MMRRSWVGFIARSCLLTLISSPFTHSQTSISLEPGVEVEVTILSH